MQFSYRIVEIRFRSRSTQKSRISTSTRSPDPTCPKAAHRKRHQQRHELLMFSGVGFENMDLWFTAWDVSSVQLSKTANTSWEHRGEQVPRGYRSGVTLRISGVLPSLKQLSDPQWGVRRSE